MFTDGAKNLLIRTVTMAASVIGHTINVRRFSYGIATYEIVT